MPELCEGEAECSLRGRADVMELVDMQDLGSCAERRRGSTPLIRTTIESGFLTIGVYVDIM